MDGPRSSGPLVAGSSHVRQPRRAAQKSLEWEAGCRPALGRLTVCWLVTDQSGSRGLLSRQGRGPKVRSGLSVPIQGCPPFGCARGPNLAAQSRPVVEQATPAPSAVLFSPAFCIAWRDWRGYFARVFFLVKPGRGRAVVWDIETPAVGSRPAAVFAWDVPQARSPHCVLSQASRSATTAHCPLRPCCYSSCYGRACRSPLPSSRAL